MNQEIITRKREELKREMIAAGFKVSGLVDKSIDLLLENLKTQKVEAGTEVQRRGHLLPGFIAVTQDYLFFFQKG